MRRLHSAAAEVPCLLHELVFTLPLVNLKLQDSASRLLVARSLLRQERGAGCVLKHFADTIVGLGRAFKVGFGTNLLLDFLSLPNTPVLASFLPRLFPFPLCPDAKYDPTEKHFRGLSEPWAGNLTCSGVTGFWEVLWSSSMVF